MDFPGYDEWKLNPPEPKVIKTCEECGCEICEGETYFDLQGAVICIEKDCFTKHAMKVLTYEEKQA